MSGDGSSARHSRAVALSFPRPPACLAGITARARHEARRPSQTLRRIWPDLPEHLARCSAASRLRLAASRAGLAASGEMLRRVSRDLRKVWREGRGISRDARRGLARPWQDLARCARGSGQGYARSGARLAASGQMPAGISRHARSRTADVPQHLARHPAASGETRSRVHARTPQDGGAQRRHNHLRRGAAHRFSELRYA